MSDGSAVHIFVDHSNIWGGARLASEIEDPESPDHLARVSIPNLDQLLSDRGGLVETRVVAGGIPPGMESLYGVYNDRGYETNLLHRDENWRERGVDHSLIGHMWRTLTVQQDDGGTLVLASGDGSTNESGTSFREVIETAVTDERFASWSVVLASFDWQYGWEANTRSPTSNEMRRLVAQSERGTFLDLMRHYDDLVFHEGR